MKKVVSSVLACVLLLFTIVSPANASPDGYDLNENGYDVIESVNDYTGNGFTQKTIYVNKEPVTAYVAVMYTPGEGTRLMVNCPSPVSIEVSINSLWVQYKLTNNALAEEQGGAVMATCSSANPSQYGYYVPFEYGMDLVSSLVSAAGSVTFYADQAVTVSVSFHG